MSRDQPVLTSVPAPRNVAEATGSLAVDPEAIAAAADDFGHLVHHVPAAIARPRSSGEISALMRSSAAAGLTVRARGAGHSVSGQAQNDGGIICHLTGMDQIGPVSNHHMVVGAGTRWSALLAASLAEGLTPPVLTDYLELTVGGTLSAGGIGGASHHHGPQVDHVLELEVVTSEGEVVTCSPTVRTEVFAGVLAGQGRGGVITCATVPLVGAPERAAVAKIQCTDLTAMLACQRGLAQQGKYGYLEGQIQADESGQWKFAAETAQWYSGLAPAAGTLLDGLAVQPASVETEDVGYAAWCHRMDPGVRLLAATGDWYRPHPWLSVFLPSEAVERYVAGVLAALTPEEAGPVPMLLYPLRRGPRPAHGLATPAPDQDGLFWSFSILRCVAGTRSAVEAALASNQAFARAAEAAGGTVYRISALP